jgi:hypothetical protein
MADKGRNDRIRELVTEVERIAKRLRTDIRKRVEETGLLKNIEGAASQLRKQAAAVAAQVERYAREMRQQLERSAKAKGKASAASKKPSRQARKAKAAMRAGSPMSSGK